MNAAAGSCKLSEAECAAFLQRSCIGALDDAALCLVLSAFCGCSDHKPELCLVSAIVSTTLVNRVSALQNPASRQLFSAVSSVVRLSCPAASCLSQVDGVV
jgi:hypothetical protein